MRGVVLFKNTCWKRRTQRSRRPHEDRRLCLDASRPALVRANNSQGGSNRSEAGADQHLAQGRGTFGATGNAYAPRVRPQAASLRRSNRSVYSARVIRVCRSVGRPSFRLEICDSVVLCLIHYLCHSTVPTAGPSTKLFGSKPRPNGWQIATSNA